jgi:hypothetical protein
VDYRQFIKRFEIPDGVVVPKLLTYEDIEARAISRADLREDVKGINSSIDIIRQTRGGRWPTEPVNEVDIFVDEVWHECEFRDDGSYTYAVYASTGRYLGCAYLYPMGRRTRLTEELLSYDVDVSWWVISTAYEEGYYTKLYRALKHWLAEDLPFTKPYFSNHEMPADD